MNGLPANAEIAGKGNHKVHETGKRKDKYERPQHVGLDLGEAGIVCREATAQKVVDGGEKPGKNENDKEDGEENKVRMVCKWCVPCNMNMCNCLVVSLFCRIFARFFAQTGKRSRRKI